jgi:uncharacterized protein
MSNPAVAVPPSRAAAVVHRHPLVTFFGLTFAASWSLWMPLVILRDHLPGAPAFVLTLLGSLVPSTVGVLVVAALHGTRGVRTLLGRLVQGRVGLRWYLAVAVLPMLVPLGLGISILLGGDTPAVDATIVGVLALFVFSIFPGSALGEEVGWRGVALPLLQGRCSALTASIVVGVLWGTWHLPLWLTGSESHPIRLYPAFVLTVIAASVIFTWMYNSTGGSLLVVVLYHAAANLPLSLLLTPLGDATTQPFLIYAALMVLTAVAVVVTTGAAHLSRTHRKMVFTTGGSDGRPDHR